MEQLAKRDQWVNRLHPLVKFVLTVFYIGITVSFPKYDVLGTAGMCVYPAAVCILAEAPLGDCLKRLRPVLLLVCLVGICNPFLDRTAVVVGGIKLSTGVFSFLTLALKGIFSVLAAYLFIATTTVEQIGNALLALHLPQTAVTQFLLTWRYLTLLLEETGRITAAYALRAPRQKGIHFKVWGSLAGQLLLRSMDRADRVYDSMLLRGYPKNGAPHKKRVLPRWQDWLWLGFWAGILLLFRCYPIILLIGNRIGGIGA